MLSAYLAYQKIFLKKMLICETMHNLEEGGFDLGCPSTTDIFAQHFFFWWDIKKDNEFPHAPCSHVFKSEQPISAFLFVYEIKVYKILWS